MEIEVPDGSLVVLVDVTAPDAVPGRRLDEITRRAAAGVLTLVEGGDRRELVRIARRHHVRPVAISAHDRLRDEGFRPVHLTGGEPFAVRVVPARSDLRHLTGPFDVIGDVHGCADELRELLGLLGYVDGAHPDGRTAVFVGDLVDRGPDTPGVLRLAMPMVRAGTALSVRGNHEDKLVRALNGHNVVVAHGLETTLAQLDDESPEFRREVAEFCDALVPHYVLDGGRLVVAHAGLPERYHGRESAKSRGLAIWGESTGALDDRGFPVRHPWALEYTGAATVLYGHTPVREATWENNTLCLDTGCAFGGALTAVRYPEREIVSVPARRVWYRQVSPASSPTPRAAGRTTREPA
ncbi:hypothetical protein GCM10022243_21630 [Saccharothrix violaceirubra]|uniref:(2Fe-2S) ferredoxin n=1 Tax=Saccharothrix violaceirubra TaxID=413306 RepID=A0A7W7T8F2_9PSEU|nr:(2Fe-2S) ferredoxin [Saccharothrix violaceirubra]